MESVLSECNSPLLSRSAVALSPRLAAAGLYDRSVRSSFHESDFFFFPEENDPFELNPSFAKKQASESQLPKEDFLDLLLSQPPQDIKVFDPHHRSHEEHPHSPKCTYRKQGITRTEGAQLVKKSREKGCAKKKRKPKTEARAKPRSDYRRDICGYVTRRVIREFISPVYQSVVTQMCTKDNVSYTNLKLLYLSLIEVVTGPRHLPQLFTADNPEEQKMKNIFKQFSKWFLNERYLRYLLSDGKMTNKKAYIEYKNMVLSKYIL